MDIPNVIDEEEKLKGILKKYEITILTNKQYER